MIKIETNEQLVELAARSTYLLSMLRSFTKEYENTKAKKSIFKDLEVEKWEKRIDDYLAGIGATEFETLSEMIEQLTIKERATH